MRCAEKAWVRIGERVKVNLGFHPNLKVLIFGDLNKAGNSATVGQNWEPKWTGTAY